MMQIAGEGDSTGSTTQKVQELLGRMIYTTTPNLLSTQRAVLNEAATTLAHWCPSSSLEDGELAGQWINLLGEVATLYH